MKKEEERLKEEEMSRVSMTSERAPAATPTASLDYQKTHGPTDKTPLLAPRAIPPRR